MDLHPPAIFRGFRRARLFRRRCQLQPVMRQHRLVGGHKRLARRQCPPRQCQRRTIGPADQPDADFARFLHVLAVRHPEVPAAVLRRWARGHGSRVELLFTPQGLGLEVAPSLFEAELHCLHRHEWARTADDVLWRRTKLGLHLTPAQRAAVARWCEAHWGVPGDALKPRR